MKKNDKLQEMFSIDNSSLFPQNIIMIKKLFLKNKCLEVEKILRKNLTNYYTLNKLIIIVFLEINKYKMWKKLWTTKIKIKMIKTNIVC